MSTFISTPLVAQEEGVASRILISDVNIFDGRSEKLTRDMSVLIEGNKIAKIANSITAPDNATVIDGGGRTLTPGFIDAHVHLQWNVGSYEFVDSPPDYHAALALVEARNTLMRGFTSVRDTGGAVFGVKKAIDQGFHPGPRIYASGAAIGMTSGHGDYRTVNELPRQLGGPSETPLERLGISVFADGVPEVLSASRDQMRRGAHYLKMFVGGAVSGLRDPLDIAEYSFEEVKAAADEAERWNTYLAVHAYTDRSVREALEAGALSIEHANLVTEETVKLAVKKGAFMSAQTGFFLGPAPDSFSQAQKERQKQAADGLDRMMKLAKKHRVKLLFGTDFVGSLDIKKLQLDEFTNRTRWFSPAEILMQATSVNAEVLSLSGPRNPYPGKLGVIEEGAYADLLLINGNPLEDISILTEPKDNLALIMKDGKIYKNTVE
jgi:imidazolonepropionase-like amidohydrolase